MRRFLPAYPADRPKVGFTVPLSPWFRNELRELLGDTLLSARALGRGYVEPAVLRGYVEEHLAGRRDRGRELWTLLTLELWHQHWIDRAPERATPWTVPPRVSTHDSARTA